MPSLPAQPGVVLLSICSSCLPAIKSPALQASYQQLRGAPGAEPMPGALSVPGLRPLPSLAGSQGSRSSRAMELTAGLRSQQRAATSHHTVCSGSRCHPPPSPRGSVPAHPGAFSRLSHPSPSPVLCSVSYTLGDFHVHWTTVGSVSGVSLHPRFLWLEFPLLTPFTLYLYSIPWQGVHNLIPCCVRLMPCQCIHRSTVRGYSDASISPAYLVAPSSLALVIVPLVWLRMLGRERGSRRCAHWTLLLVITGDWCSWLKPVCPAAILLLGWPQCHARGQAGARDGAEPRRVASSPGCFLHPPLHEHEGLDPLWKEKE